MQEPLAFLARLRAGRSRMVSFDGRARLADPCSNAALADTVNAVVRAFRPPIADGNVSPRFDIALKDIFVLPGHTPGGGTLLPVTRPTETGEVVSRLLQSGAQILGVLNQDEVAAGGSGHNRHHGRSINPWNRAHLTGGSSGGSAAAVAAGLVPVALGSDSGGSIRIPAAWCGVTGHKPTYGLVSRSGAMARSWSADCIGPMARSAAECAALLSIIAGEDPRDPATWNRPVARPYGAFPMRIVRPVLQSSVQPDSETIAALDQAERGFADLGFEIARGGAPDFDDLNRRHQLIVRSEAAVLHARCAADFPDLVESGIAAGLAVGQSISAVDLLRAMMTRADAIDEVLRDVFGECDLLLLPVTPSPAPPASAAPAEQQLHADALYTRFANYLGLPATAFPIGRSASGLPLAAQLVGRPFEDTLCLSAVMAFQQATRHHTLRPPQVAVAGC